MAGSTAVGRAVLWGRRKVWLALPKRRTVVRAFLCSVLFLMPFLSLVTIHSPHTMLPFWFAIFAIAYYSGAVEDVAKQIRWMRRMSARGPIFWLLAFLQRMWVKLLRRVYGDRMDRFPLTPTQIGLTHRSSKAATIKWNVPPRSIYTSEKYHLQIRLVDPLIIAMLERGESGEDGKELTDWIDLEKEIATTELKAAPLQARCALPHARPCARQRPAPLAPNTAYEARVRAVNSKGESDWISHAFRTKQAAVEGGGTGPLAPESEVYQWKQHTKDETLTVLVPVPAETRGKQLAVHVMPTTLRITLCSDVLLEGTFHAPVRHSVIRACSEQPEEDISFPCVQSSPHARAGWVEQAAANAG
ncbi:MAG: hypothetical protein SGPRY_013180 [Prymnesium sp.]